MADLDPRTIASKLLIDRFQHSAPAASTLSDPVTDTPMIVTLDQLQPYDLDPRVTRNPRYDEIKSSIRERHLDAPPPITRRPGATHYTIRNGGNTRLRILQELWAETKDEKYFRICCLFRPWTERGEIIALTGHLAENELRGRLSFIERAYGVQKVRELYQAESGKPVSQAELARRLTSDGYPITQSQISRMQDALEYLLPAIPTVLYAGLGRPAIEKLSALRKAADRAWERNKAEAPAHVDFPSLFQDVLAQFDHDPSTFDVQRVRDELIGQMAQLLSQDYDALALQILDAEGWLRSLNQAPAEQTAPRSTAPAASTSTAKSVAPRESTTAAQPSAEASATKVDAQSADAPAGTAPRSVEEDRTVVTAPHVSGQQLEPSPAPGRSVDGEQKQEKAAQAMTATPAAADRGEDARSQLIESARKIAVDVGAADCIRPIEGGLGFACNVSTDSPSPVQRAVLQLLHSLSAPTELGLLLIGDPSNDSTRADVRLSDEAIEHVFKLIRLARALVDSTLTSRE